MSTPAITSDKIFRMDKDLQFTSASQFPIVLEVTQENTVDNLIDVVGNLDCNEDLFWGELGFYYDFIMRTDKK